MVMSPLVLPLCPRCNVANVRQSVFCDNCRLYLADATLHVERVTYNRRFWGSYMLEGLLMIVTLFIGWLIWLIFTSKTGQSPAKRLLNLYVVKLDTGRGIGQADSWIREVLVKILAVGAAGLIIPFASQIDAIWIFFDKNRQTLHDKILSQIVVYAPAGLPESMQSMQFPPPLLTQPYAPAEPSVYATPPETPAGAPAAGGSMQAMAADLQHIARLRDQGLISAQEYEARRARIVGGGATGAAAEGDDTPG